MRIIPENGKELRDCLHLDLLETADFPHAEREEYVTITLRVMNPVVSKNAGTRLPLIPPSLDSGVYTCGSAKYALLRREIAVAPTNWGLPVQHRGAAGLLSLRQRWTTSFGIESSVWNVIHHAERDGYVLFTLRVKRDKKQFYNKPT